MTEQIKETLYQVAEEVLEKLAFIFSFPEEERDSTNYDAMVAATVSFSGPFPGSLIMVVSREILPELTGNMLGLDDGEETTVEQQYDALKELINVLCGNLLPAIAGKQTIFHVDTPEIVSEDIEAFCQNISMKRDTPGSVHIARLDIENEQCDLMLFLDGDILAQASQ